MRVRVLVQVLAHPFFWSVSRKFSFLRKTLREFEQASERKMSSAGGEALVASLAELDVIGSRGWRRCAAACCVKVCVCVRVRGGRRRQERLLPGHACCAVHPPLLGQRDWTAAGPRMLLHFPLNPKP